MGTEWENEAHIFYASLNLAPMPKLECGATISYTVGEADMDNLDFTAADDPFNLRGYSFANLNGADEFSDLDYQALELEIQATYQILENISVTLNYWYSDFDDDEEYVYGDLDGDAYVFTGFITYRF